MDFSLTVAECARDCIDNVVGQISNVSEEPIKEFHHVGAKIQNGVAQVLEGIPNCLGSGHHCVTNSLHSVTQSFKNCVEDSETSSDRVTPIAVASNPHP